MQLWHRLILVNNSFYLPVKDRKGKWRQCLFYDYSNNYNILCTIFTGWTLAATLTLRETGLGAIRSRTFLDSPQRVILYLHDVFEALGS